MASLSFRSILAASLLAGLSDGSSTLWEWEGAFTFTSTEHLVWTAARVDGQYAANTMKMVIKKINSATSADLTGAHTSATTHWTGTAPTNIAAAGEVAVDASDKVYTLTMNTQTWVSMFEIKPSVVGTYAFFISPSPMDFENGFHFLKTETGTDVEPVVSDSHAAHATAAICPAEEHWEWGGVFQLAAGWHTWSAERGTGGSYADATMRIVFVPMTGADEDDVTAAVNTGKQRWDGSATAVAAGGNLALDTLMELTFDTHSWGSYFYLNVATPTHVGIFAQHLPTEFENKFHYLKKADGSDVEPIVQKSCAAPAPAAAATTTVEHNDLWGAVLVGSLITCLPTLFGVFFFTAQIAQGVRNFLAKTQIYLNSFASGVIFAAAVFLLLPEALHLAGSGHDEEVVGTWTWGTSVMVGWFTCIVIIMVARAIFQGVSAAPAAASDSDTLATGDTGAEDKPLDRASFLAIVGPVLFGDFFHNFSDGLVIGVAFKACGSSFGWELVGVTFAHELPQEIADLLVLVLNAKMKWWKATTWNFVCSLSTVIGAIITYSSSVGTNEEGYILAYGGGTYLFVALTEIARHVVDSKEAGIGEIAGILLSFTVGCIIMGLVLIGHEHCSPTVVSADGTAVAAPSTGGHHH